MNIAKLLTAKHEQETVVSIFPQGREVIADSPTGFRKSMIFPVFHCFRSPDKNCEVYMKFAEVTGSNPVEVLIFFFRLLLSSCLNLEHLLR